MSKINLSTLAANASRAKQRLDRQQEKLKRLTDQIIDRVGTGGRTIITSLGQVIVSQQTFDRAGDGYFLQFNEDTFRNLPQAIRHQIMSHGVVSLQPKMIRGQGPRVQFRFNTEKKDV